MRIIVKIYDVISNRHMELFLGLIHIHVTTKNLCDQRLLVNNHEAVYSQFVSPAPLLEVVLFTRCIRCHCVYSHSVQPIFEPP